MRLDELNDWQKWAYNCVMSHMETLTLDRIFNSKEFNTKSFGPARWLDGDAYTTLESVADSKKPRELVRYDCAKGTREVLVSLAMLTPAGQTIPLTIKNYHWSEDKTRLLIFTNSKQVWRQHTRGDYWVLTLKTGQLQKLGGEAKPSTLMFAKFSPNGESVAYVRENNIYVESLADGIIVPLTTDGDETIINGTSDWVYEEELKLRDGFRWNPAGTHIAYWQFDTTGLQPFYLINNTDTLYPKLTALPYPKVGTTNSACRVGVVSASGGETTWFAVPGDPRNNYIAKMAWAESSEQVLIQQLNRLQNRNQLMFGNINTGEIEHVLTERDDAWVPMHNDLKWLSDGAEFTWASEREGWRQLYRVSRDGEQIIRLTDGSFDALDIRAVDEASGHVYFIASPNDAGQRYLFRVNLDGSGGTARVTPAGNPGTHFYNISPNARYAFHTYNNFNKPSVVSLISLPDHRTIRVLEDNQAVHEKVRQLAQSPTEFFRVDIGDGVELDGWCIKPPDFDPAGSYPVLFYVYGEPASQTVRDVWYGKRYLWHLMMAQQGYVIISVDNRGTPAPRGREWRKCIYRQVGILSTADQAEAAKALLAERTYLDPGRVGVWGWSGGGSMTLNLMFKHPDIYHTGIAIAAVSDQRYYDTIYQERYMGLPDDNPDGFRDGSPIHFAHQLQGNLLLIHGTGDDNVHYQCTEAVINELIKHNKPFDIMAYPNRAHGINEGKNTSRHLYSLMTRYLDTHLKEEKHG